MSRVQVRNTIWVVVQQAGFQNISEAFYTEAAMGKAAMEKYKDDLKKVIRLQRFEWHFLR